MNPPPARGGREPISPDLPFRLLVAVLFGLVLVCAAWQRFSLPLAPVFDPDSPGYIHPALSSLSGHGFQQTQGRPFLYPALVLGLLNASGNLKSIVAMQHVVSLLAAVAWMGVWLVWSSFLPRGWTRRFLAPLVGVTAAGFYLAGAETVMFGLQVRPEAVFPLAAALQLLCLMVFVKARWPAAEKPAGFLAVASGTGAMIFTAAAYNLKPSWGFAILLTPLVLGLGALFRPSGLSVARAAAPLVSGCIAALLLLAAVPAALHWKRDDASKSFLAMNLFAVHANIISDYLQGEVDAGRASAEEVEFSGRLRSGIRESRDRLGRYVLLGHNPDYLMYGSQTLVWIPRVSTVEERRAYYFQTLFSSMLRYPGRYAAKWLVQLRAAVFQDPKYLSRSSGNFKKLYSLSVPPSGSLYPDLRQDLAKSLAQAAAETPALVSSLPGKQVTGPKWLKGTGAAGAFLYPCALAASVILLAAAPLFFRDHLRAVLAASLVSAAAFLSTMTVAFVHSFDIDRYLSLQSWLAWLTISCWAAVVLSVVESRLRRQFQTANEPA